MPVNNRLALIGEYVARSKIDETGQPITFPRNFL
jgi:hypothetical protein